MYTESHRPTNKKLPPHGDINTYGEPIILNYQLIPVIQKQLENLKEAGLHFHTILLSSCFSAAFLPEVEALLTEDGVVFCQLLSSLSGATDTLAYAKECHHDLFSAYYAMLESKIRKVDGLALNMELCLPFISDAIYSHRSKDLHCLSTSELEMGLVSHNELINAGENPDTINELKAIRTYLLSRGIQIIDHYASLDALEVAIRSFRDKTVILPMEHSDICEIKSIDKQIFPQEDPLDQEQYFHQAYSFIAKRCDEILGYIIVRPKDKGTLFIGNFGVVPHEQGTGIGSSLLNSVLAKADEEHREVELRVRVTNVKAIDFYTRQGFNVTSADSNNDWSYMTRPKKQKSDQSSNSQIYATPHGLNKLPPKTPLPPSPPSANFILQSMAVLSAGAALLTLACLLLPPIGLIPVGCAFVGYALASVSMASGLGVIGLWGHHLSQRAEMPPLESKAEFSASFNDG